VMSMLPGWLIQRPMRAEGGMLLTMPCSLRYRMHLACATWRCKCQLGRMLSLVVSVQDQWGYVLVCWVMALLGLLPRIFLGDTSCSRLSQHRVRYLIFSLEIPSSGGLVFRELLSPLVNQQHQNCTQIVKCTPAYTNLQSDLHQQTPPPQPQNPKTPADLSTSTPAASPRFPFHSAQSGPSAPKSSPLRQARHPYRTS
jgi:hypothetical protein